MKKLKIAVIAMLMIALSSCQRGCQSFERSFQSSKLHYDIKVYSGGQCIYHDNITTIVNNSEHSDGVYYYKGDTLVELCGQYVIKAD